MLLKRESASRERADLASFGMDLWSRRWSIKRAARSWPRRCRDSCGSPSWRCGIPRMEVVALERLAATAGETGRTVLARELRDLVSVHSEWLSEEVPSPRRWPRPSFRSSPGRAAAERPVGRPALSE